MAKTINVDVRFVLWTIDKYAGARRIVDELKLVRDENTPADTKTKTQEQQLLLQNLRKIIVSDYNFINREMYVSRFFYF